MRKLLISLIIFLFFEVFLTIPLDFMYEDELRFCSYPKTVFEYLVMPDAFCQDSFNPFYVNEWKQVEGFEDLPPWGLDNEK